MAGPLVGPERLREIQRRWQNEANEIVRRALAREYEKLLVANGAAEASHGPAKPLHATGEGFSFSVARFFPAMFSHVKGPAAGQPFKLEPWQRRFVEEFSRTNGGGERIYKRGMVGVARGTPGSWLWVKACGPAAG